MKKRLCSVLLTLALLLSLLPQLALPVRAAAYSGTCGAEGDGSNLTWTLDTQTGVLTIAGTGRMVDFSIAWKSGGIEWQEYADQILAVELPDGLVNVGSYAFVGSRNLRQIEIPDSVTEIAYCAFLDCSGLQTVKIGCGVTNFDYGAFGGCHQISEVWLDTPTVPSWFGGMPSLSTVVFGEHVTSIGDFAFDGCTGLTEIDMSVSVTEIGDYAFRYCSGLQTVKIGCGLTSIGCFVFEGCDQISEVWLDTPTVPSWFSGLQALTTVVLGEHVTAIGDSAFAGCTALSDIALPQTVTSIGSWAFSTCTALESLSLPDSITSIGTGAFNNCTALTALSLPAAVTEISPSLFYGCTNLQTMTIRDGVTEIGQAAFSGCEKLDGIVLPESLVNIGVEAFRGCAMLQQITLGQNVEVVDDDAFRDCANLYDVTVLNGRCQIEYRRGTMNSYKTTTIHGYLNSTAHYYARAYAYDFDVIEREASCTGMHDWGEWTPLRTASGEDGQTETRTCYACGRTETRQIGDDGPIFSNPFSDVKEGAYYYEPVLWAYYHDPQITDGTGETTFSPKRACTRAEIVTFLWRAMGRPRTSLKTSRFSDVDPEAYYYSAVLWAEEKGLTQGVDGERFDPDSRCSRAETVTFLWRAAGSPAPETSECVFEDVPEDAWYRDAVLWAVERGVTDGTAPDAFSPGRLCTRGQVATFLRRALGE